MTVLIANPEHEVAYQDLADLLAKHAASMTKSELLAVAANMVGKMVALQDQRTTSPESAMAIVAANIEVGNRQVLDMLLRTKGNA